MAEKESAAENPAANGGGKKQTELSEKDVKAFWMANVKLISALLAVWFVVSFGFGILLVEPLNKIPFFGFKLGFWWAQQGSIYVFVALIFIYAEGIKRIERRHGVGDR